ESRPDLSGAAPTPPSPTSVAEPAGYPPTRVAAPTVNYDAVKEKVVEIVAEKTGYPKDMLDLDLDLEADLGVDTVKQAEMFASVRAAYNIPREESLKLRDFPTLAHVIQFAIDKQTATPVVSASLAGAAAPPSAETAKPASTPARAVRPRPVLASFDAADRVPRRVPMPTLRPPLNICKPTGVTLGPGSRVVIMPDQGGVANALRQCLRSLGVEVLVLDDTRDAAVLTDLLNKWASASPVQGVYCLRALDYEGAIGEMDLPAWREALRVRVKSLYVVMRSLFQQIAAPGTFLVTATRLGGHHGYDDAGAVAPLGGAVAGFTKTYKRERPDALVKVVDFESQRDPAEVAGLVVEETLRDTGAVEIGYKNELRWAVALREQPVADGNRPLTLDENSVFVVTGAAGSIVSAITADLAAASGGTFYLLDV